jgi:hypothetical protein
MQHVYEAELHKKNYGETAVKILILQMISISVKMPSAISWIKVGTTCVLCFDGDGILNSSNACCLSVFITLI